MKTGIMLVVVALLAGVLLGCGDLTELNRMLSNSAQREKRVLEQIDKIRAEIVNQRVELDKIEAMLAESDRMLAENNKKIAEINKMMKK